MRMSLSSENKLEKFSSFPRLKFNKDEKGRIVCLEEPEVAYTHTLRMPEMLNGRPKMEKRKTKGGEEYEAHAMEFISRPLCIGDFEIVAERGSDPKNCPACAASAKSDQVPGPERRFAMHVAQYALKAGGSGFTIAEPFSVSIVVWTFGDKVFNELADIAAEIQDPRGLKAHDLNLGPCISEKFQTFKIQPAMSAEYLASPARQKQVKETFENNQAEDLLKLIGKKMEAEWMKEDLEKIEARWRLVNGASSPISSVGSASLDSSLSELENEADAPTTSSEAMPFSDLFSGVDLS